MAGLGAPTLSSERDHFLLTSCKLTNYQASPVTQGPTSFPGRPLAYLGQDWNTQVDFSKDSEMTTENTQTASMTQPTHLGLLMDGPAFLPPPHLWQAHSLQPTPGSKLFREAVLSPLFHPPGASLSWDFMSGFQPPASANIPGTDL